MMSKDSNGFDCENESRIPLYKFRRQQNIVNEDYDKSSKFIGREQELLKFIDVLEETKNGGGAFLVSGYRGAGKTRFVNRALLNYIKPKNKKKKTNVIDVKINLGNDTRLDSKTILSDMATLLREKVKHSSNQCIGALTRLTEVLITVLFTIPIVVLAFSLASQHWSTARIPFFALSNNAYYFFYFLGALVVIFVYVLHRIGVRNLIKNAIQASVFIGLIILFWTYLLFWPQATTYLTPLYNDATFFLYVIASLSTITLILSGIIYLMGEEKANILKELDKLIVRIHTTSEASTESGIQIGNKKYGHAHNAKTKKIIASPIGTNEIELQLQQILAKSKFDVFFIFDELDKLSGSTSDNFEVSISGSHETKYRKRQVDRLLGELKNLITRSNARYIFIAGRDMYDAYLGESGSTNSLYESLFSGHIYIPSLHTDRTDGETYLLDSIIETFVVSRLMECDPNGKLINDKTIAVKLTDYNNGLVKIAKNKRMENIFLLKIFIHFLAFHSWGNYKRLITLFESFVRKNSENKYELVFETKDMQRLILASHLYVLFHHNLSQTLMNADDKLVVSAFSVYHYIMKYHGMGFSRIHINRMYEAINIHSSPELSRIVDEIIGNVLSNHIRRIRNSFYRYRFSSLYERELHFITTISDNDSAAFNFSLDAMESVKQHYINILDDNKRTSDKNYEISMAPIRTVLGDYFLWEQSHDEASVQYGIASKILEEHQSENDFHTLIKLVEVCLKKASVAERSRNITVAVAIYMQAERYIEQSKILSSSAIEKQDSKWDVVLQPYWARRFLNLKRSAVHYNSVNHDSSRLYNNNEVHQYRAGILALFMENHQEAFTNFIDAAEKVDVLNVHNERASFLGGNACLKAGLTLFSKYGSDTYKALAKLERQNNTNTDPYSQKKEVLRRVLTVQFKNLEAIFKGLNETRKDGALTLDDLKSRVIDEAHNTDFKRFKFDMLKAGEINYGTETSNKQESLLTSALGLMVVAAESFKACRLHSNSAQSYLSINMMWEMFLELLPWRLFSKENGSALIKELFGHNGLPGQAEQIRKHITSIRPPQDDTKNSVKNWIIEAQKQAFECNVLATGKALSHSQKTTLRRNLKIQLHETPFLESSARKRVFHKDFLNHLLYQHYSIYGQLTIAAMLWEQMAASHIETGSSSEVMNIENKFLPFSVRYYSIMLWMKGKQYLSQLNNAPYDKGENKDKDKYLPKEKIITAINALINFSRASQYVSKTQGDASSMVLPPLFLIYYNMWETMYRQVSEYGRLSDYKDTYEQAIAHVHDEMDKEMKKVKDVSSRILDLSYLTQSAMDQFKITEKMGDPNSRNRTSILRNKYYLDDDYEDNMFHLDWCYCRAFAPGALVHRLTIEFEMERLKKQFRDKNQ